MMESTATHTKAGENILVGRLFEIGRSMGSSQ